jgi:hypothetical protein
MISCAPGSPTPKSAEARYTAFASRKRQAVTARPLVRRVRDLNKQATEGQDELFPLWRYHAVFELIQAEGQTAATPSWSKSSPTSPTGRWRICHRARLPRTPAWLACAAIAHNLLRDEASFLGELVDDVEFGEDALCGVDHGGDRGYVAFELQETIAVRRAVTVEAQKPRWVVAPLIPAERSRRTMARAEPRRGRDGPAGSLRVDHRAARSGHPQADGDGGPLQLSLYSRPGGHVATADGGRRSATRWTATLARSGSA